MPTKRKVREVIIERTPTLAMKEVNFLEEKIARLKPLVSGLATLQRITEENTAKRQELRSLDVILASKHEMALKLKQDAKDAIQQEREDMLADIVEQKSEMAEAHREAMASANTLRAKIETDIKDIEKRFGAVNRVEQELQERETTISQKEDRVATEEARIEKERFDGGVLSDQLDERQLSLNDATSLVKHKETKNEAHEQRLRELDLEIARKRDAANATAKEAASLLARSQRIERDTDANTQALAVKIQTVNDAGAQVTQREAVVKRSETDLATKAQKVEAFERKQVQRERVLTSMQTSLEQEKKTVERMRLEVRQELAKLEQMRRAQRQQ